jgi:dihydrofolate reductase
VSGDVEAVARGLKASHSGESDISGTVITQSLTDPCLVDEYRLYYQPLVLSCGKPFFAGPQLLLRLTKSETFGERAIRLTNEPARSAARTPPLASPAQLR